MSHRHDGWGRIGPWPGPLDRRPVDEMKEELSAPNFSGEIAVQGEPPKKEALEAKTSS